MSTAAAISQKIRDFGAQSWYVGKDILASVATGISESKNSPNVAADLCRLAIEMNKGGALPLTGKLISSAINLSGFVDATQFVCDSQPIVTGSFKDETVGFTCQQFFFSLSGLSSTIGYGAQASLYTLGKGMSVFAGATVGTGLAAVGFAAMAVNSYIHFINSKDSSQSIYFGQMCARSTAATFAFTVFTATAAGVALPAILLGLAKAAVVSGLVLSFTSHYYRKNHGNEKIIEKLSEDKAIKAWSTSKVFHLNNESVRNGIIGKVFGGISNVLTPVSNGLNTIFENTDLTEKYIKAHKSISEGSVMFMTFLEKHGSNIDFSFLKGIVGNKFLLKAMGEFSKDISGLNDLNRLAEWTKLDENGVPEYKKWGTYQYFNRVFLTIGHTGGLFKWLEGKDLINLGRIGANFVVKGFTFNLFMLQDCAIIIASGFGFMKSTDDVTKAQEQLQEADTKPTTKVAVFAGLNGKGGNITENFKEWLKTTYTKERIESEKTRLVKQTSKYQQESGSEKKAEDKVEKPPEQTGAEKKDIETEKKKPKAPVISEASTRKHEIYRELAENDFLSDNVKVKTYLETKRNAYQKELDDYNTQIKEKQSGLTRGYFRWKEIRDLTKKAKDETESIEVIDWYLNIMTSQPTYQRPYPKEDSAVSFLQPGVEFKFPDGKGPVFTPNEPLIIPAGTTIKLPLGRNSIEAKLDKEIAVLLPEGQAFADCGQNTIRIEGSTSHYFGSSKTFLRQGAEILIEKAESEKADPSKDKQPAEAAETAKAKTNILLPIRYNEDGKVDYASVTYEGTIYSDDHYYDAGTVPVDCGDKICFKNIVPEANPIFLHDGVKIKLPENEDPIKLNANIATALPAGTTIYIPSGHKLDADKNKIQTYKEVVLPVKVNIALKPGQKAVDLNASEAVSIPAEAALMPPKGSTFLHAFMYKAISKAHRWTEIRQVKENMLPKVKCKGKISKFYDGGKICCCVTSIISTIFAFSSPIFYVFFIPTGLAGVAKGLYDSHLKKLQGDDHSGYKDLPSRLYKKTAKSASSH